jgi:threonine dehydratase
LEAINVEPDIVLCCCGGGGLIAGISTAIRGKFLKTKIYSVEPEHFDDTKKSLEKNEIVSNLMNNNSICDALLAEKPGSITFEINKLNLTSGLTVSDNESLIAMNTAYKHFKIVLEPGGAVALAAALLKKVDIKNKNVLVIASGGNVDKNVFENCLKTEAI